MAKEIRDFQVLDKIAQENSPDGIGFFPSIIGFDKYSRGGVVKIGIPPTAFSWALSDTHHFVLYAIKKSDYERVRSEMENEED